MIPILKNEQILLRPFKQSDAHQVTEMASDYALYRTTLNLPHPYTFNDAVDWIQAHPAYVMEHGFYTWAIVRPSDDTLVGCFSLSQNLKHKTAEVGYWIGKAYWGNGYGTHATKIAMDYAFDFLKINKLIGRYFCVNPASGRIMEKCGMKFEGILKESIYKDDTYHDIGFYGLLRSEWLKFPNHINRITLDIKQIDKSQASALQYIQERAFAEDIERYGNRADCPANESLERLMTKIEQYEYYGIYENSKLIGGADIRYNEAEQTCRLARIYIDPRYQNLKIGKIVLNHLESLYPEAVTWTLDTPYKNFRNQHFYESIGYKRNGINVLDDVLTLIEYEKKRSL